MRLLLLAAFQFFFQLAAGQDLLNRPVSVSFNDLGVERCLHKIEQLSGIGFSYNSKQISSVETKVTASFTEEPLKNVLDRILLNTQFAYKEIGGQVTIYQIQASG